MNDTVSRLFSLSDTKYRDFQSRLIPTLDKNKIIGVRTPELRRIAKEFSEHDTEIFLQELPHRYYEENNLHAFLIEKTKNFELCIFQTEAFLPYIDNWATCDSFSPKIFKKHKNKLLIHIYKWLDSEHTYTVRFAIKMLMEHFLGEDFSDSFPKKISQIRTNEYYVKMMIAWYFATALAKQYDSIISYIASHALDDDIHKMTIKKALESYRISDHQKAFFREIH